MSLRGRELEDTLRQSDSDGGAFHLEADNRSFFGTGKLDRVQTWNFSALLCTQEIRYQALL